MLTASSYMNSGLSSSQAAGSRPATVRFGAIGDDPFSALAGKLPPATVERIANAATNARYASIAASSVLPFTEFALNEFAADQLHQHRALKDAYEILLPKDLAKISFDQIIGHEDAKRELQEFVARQDFRHLFNYLYKGDARGANNAALLTGPAGTGKTLLGKAVAANAKDTAMVNIHCETLNQMLKQRNAAKKFEKRLKNLYQKRIVLFFDEMEVLGSRTSLQTNQDEYKTITWLLKTMDGMKSLKDKELLIIGTTNHPELLDPAIRNRFQQIIQVKAPDHDELKKLYELYLNNDDKKLRLKGSLDLDAAAEASQGFTGRKVEQVVSILKRHQLLNLPDEEKIRLNQQVLDSQKGFFKKRKPSLDIKLNYTQEDLLSAISLARSGIDVVAASTNKRSDFELVA